MKQSEKVYRKNKDIVSREIDNELILMPIYKTNKEINEMYTLNESAAKTWNLIDGKRILGRIIDELHKFYGIQRERIEADIIEFVKDLKKIKVID